jgi:hypothetical protein
LVGGKYILANTENWWFFTKRGKNPNPHKMHTGWRFWDEQ